MPDPGRFLGSTELPWDEGRRDATPAYWRDVGPVEAARAAPHKTLADWHADHVLFHAGLLHAACGRDPVALHWAEAGTRRFDRPVLVELGCRLFQGEMSEPYDRVVFACPTGAWAGLTRALDRFAFLAQHSSRTLVWESRHAVWPVLDPFAARKLTAGRPAPLRPPVVPVHLFGLASEAGEYEWLPTKSPWTEPTRLAFRAAGPTGSSSAPSAPRPRSGPDRTHRSTP